MLINRPLFLEISLLILFQIIFSTAKIPENIRDDEPCYTCKQISEKFLEGYEKTAGSNFGGGNTDWEERKLKGYAKSETRFIEIIENACTRTESQCTTFLEKYEDSIEEWYQNNGPESLNSFYSWLCIDTAKVCCPEGTFGKNCRRCQYGDNGRVCSGNGVCNGDGIRSGNGRCVCESKFSGTNCSNCHAGYRQSIDKDKQVICTDIDECRSNIFLSPCLLYKCNNTEGSYECYGQPFFQEPPKITALAVLLITASIFMYKELYGLATFSLFIASILIVLFAKNIL